MHQAGKAAHPLICRRRIELHPGEEVQRRKGICTDVDIERVVGSNFPLANSPRMREILKSS